MAEPINQNAGQVTLEVLDPPDLEQVQAGPEFKRWLSNVVDIVNANFALLDNTLDFLLSSFDFLITSAGIDVGGGGAGPITVTVIGLTASGYVLATLVSSSNPVTIIDITPITNGFTITFSSDPGVSAIIVYQAYMSQPLEGTNI